MEMNQSMFYISITSMFVLFISASSKIVAIAIFSKMFYFVFLLLILIFMYFYLIINND